MASVTGVSMGRAYQPPAVRCQWKRKADIGAASSAVQEKMLKVFGVLRYPHHRPLQLGIRHQKSTSDGFPFAPSEPLEKPRRLDRADRPMRFLSYRSAGALLGWLGLWFACPSEAATIWTWSYLGIGISASGVLTTGDTPDSEGFFEISAISGQRNGVSIIGLQPVGTAIPGNEPYGVDDLIHPAAPQLTIDGFGYLLANGSSASPFWLSALTPPRYLEIFSIPSAGGPLLTEVAVVFEARIVDSAVPEIDPAAGMNALWLAAGVLAIGEQRRRVGGGS